MPHDESVDRNTRPSTTLYSKARVAHTMATRQRKLAGVLEPRNPCRLRCTGAMPMAARPKLKAPLRTDERACTHATCGNIDIRWRIRCTRTHMQCGGRYMRSGVGRQHASAEKSTRLYTPGVDWLLC